jgi:hypothetical protein
MDNLSLPTLDKPGVRDQVSEIRGQASSVLAVGFGDSIAQDFVQRSGAGYRFAEVAQLAGHTPATSVVLFLCPRLTEVKRRALDAFLGRAAKWGTEFVAIVSSFRADLGDTAAQEAEAYVAKCAKAMGARIAIFRTGYVLPRISDSLRRLGAIYPLVPGRLCSCFLSAEELFAAIESEIRATDSRRMRIFSLLGPKRSWRTMLAERRKKSLLSTCVTTASFLLSWLLVGQFAALILAALARCLPSLRRLTVGTLQPHSFRDLLTIYNKYNHRYVKVVGYNNGVVHFGHQYPGKTVVSTVQCNRAVMAGADLLKADCGTTVRKALDYLGGAGLELPVVPNYSYVCLGTAFFVPIHGSAADFSTIAETITRAVLYDPRTDRILSVASAEPEFRACVYNLQADVLVLRLYLRVKPKSRYFIRKEELANPSGAELLKALRDTRAANVEIRKARADAATVTLCKYYHDAGDKQGPVLELPRDALGRLWDRLEENPVTSFLMHTSARHLAWHVELFFTAEEFATFWQTHRSLPLKKIQVRYIRRDGLPHSPFCAHDCVSVDLFMLRGNRQQFEAYLANTFTVVRTNPGKHSR